MIALKEDTVQGFADIYVEKRDGRRVAFDADKIYKALVKASQEVTTMTPLLEAKLEGITNKIVAEVIARFPAGVKIYEIQNIVEHELLNANEYAIAESYITYRTQRDFARSKATDINFTIGKLLNKDQAVVNENANKDSDVFNTQRDLTAGIVGKSIGLQMLPPHVANAHQKGDIHYHDLDYSPYTPMTNCCLIDFKGMLGNGFKIGNAEVESPKSIQTATAQISQIIANVASSQYGGCSADRIDEVLAPYAEKNYEKHLKDAREWVFPEKQEEYAWAKTKKDIYDAMQSLEYEINTLFTSNGQTPFTSLGFGLGTNRFEREIQKAILQIRIKGLGSEHRTAIFPKLIFTLKRGLNLEPGSPNYDIKRLALECATKRMYPDVLSYDKIVELTGSFKVPMGCRSFLQGWKDENGQEVNSGRMNLGVVTVNLPRIALESEGNMDKFWEILDERLELCHRALRLRHERLLGTPSDVAPILWQHGALARLKEGELIDKLLYNGYSTISLGYAGLCEMCYRMIGETHTSKAGEEFALKVMQRLNDKCAEWKAAENISYSVYGTPTLIPWGLVA